MIVRHGLVKKAIHFSNCFESSFLIAATDMLDWNFMKPMNAWVRNPASVLSNPISANNDRMKEMYSWDYVNGGRVVFEDVIQQDYDETNNEFGTDFKAPLD